MQINRNTLYLEREGIKCRKLKYTIFWNTLYLIGGAWMHLIWSLRGKINFWKHVSWILRVVIYGSHFSLKDLQVWRTQNEKKDKSEWGKRLILVMLSHLEQNKENLNNGLGHLSWKRQYELYGIHINTLKILLLNNIKKVLMIIGYW